MDLEHSNNLPKNELFQHVCHLRSSWIQGAQKWPQWYSKVVPRSSKVLQNDPKWSQWCPKVSLRSSKELQNDLLVIQTGPGITKLDPKWSTLQLKLHGYPKLCRNSSNLYEMLIQAPLLCVFIVLQTLSWNNDYLGAPCCSLESRSG